MLKKDQIIKEAISQNEICVKISKLLLKCDQGFSQTISIFINMLARYYILGCCNDKDLDEIKEELFSSLDYTLDQYYKYKLKNDK